MNGQHYTGGLAPTASAANIQLQMACRIALRYSHRLPTVKELQDEFGMHRATAYRWIAAMRAARDELQNSHQEQGKRHG
jgi:predicted DNA-binding transcriptional regulator YafY